MKRRENEIGVVHLASRNHQTLSYVRCSHSEGKSPAQKTQRNQQALTFLDVQGNGNLDERISEFVQHPRVKQIATDKLAVECHLGPQATTDFMVTGGFTKEQMRIIQAAGMKIASEEEVKRERDRRQLPMSHQSLKLQVSPQRGETAELIEVFSLLLHPSFFLNLRKEAETISKKKKKRECITPKERFPQPLSRMQS